MFILRRLRFFSRLFDHLTCGSRPLSLLNCVRASDLLRALSDPVHVLRRPDGPRDVRAGFQWHGIGGIVGRYCFAFLHFGIVVATFASAYLIYPLINVRILISSSS